MVGWWEGIQLQKKTLLLIPKFHFENRQMKKTNASRLRNSAQLVSTFILSGLDYCNAMLAGAATRHHRLVDCVQLVNSSSIRHPRSSDTTDYFRRTTRTKFGERGFSYSGPTAWNSLSPHLHTVTDTNAFKRHLSLFHSFVSTSGQVV